MTQVPVEISETVSGSGGSRRFVDLRGVQWRVDLGILPSYPSSSIDDLRRVTANSRRRYAALRRQLLVDPHVPKDGSNSPDLVMDNPLSQNPDSMWGRFFKNAELERMVDQDLARLYPERGSYFQSSECQGMLRRMLLLWCLRHPEYGYRQGMHELLAPLLYVLHVDVERLSEVRKAHEDHFADKFDGFSFHENDLTYKFDFKKFSESSENWNGFEKNSGKSSSPSELDPEIQTIVLLTDAYGAEGELGIVISEKFMEHDAYSMFDALMNGAGGAVAMAEFFSPLAFNSANTGIPPVIEASSSLYHLLSVVDSSLHSHLIELGVEPQYFALRWLRVLFGREFSLEDLLVIWDEIFSHENAKFIKATDSNEESYSGVLCSSRGGFISAFAVSMMLNLRSSLLATENATTCLQRLLNFSDTVNLVKLIEKAKSLQGLAVEANKSNSLIIHSGLYDSRKSTNHRGHSLSLDLSASPLTPLNMVRESYWEERWRVLHKEEEQKQDSVEKQVQYRKNGWSEKVRVRLARTESDPSPAKKNERTKIPKPSVRRSLLEDLERQLGLDEDKETEACNKNIHHDPFEVNGLGDLNEKNLSDGLNDVSGEETSSNFSSPPSPARASSVQEIESGSSVASNSSIDIVQSNDSESCEKDQESSPLPISDPLDGLSSKGTENEDSIGKSASSMERKPISGKFQWLWKFGRTASEGISEKKSAPEDAKTSNGGDSENKVAGFSTADACDGSSRINKAETADQNVMASLRNLGQSMLENIQVIESILPQDQRGQMGSFDNLSKNGLVGKGQVTAMAALKELRKISNLLSEM
ncbi:uncharacterized protein [Henckelia pumila]|uniref:uncharacterized protein n=1 Tax=Henckelia pumila TaxID=405737 RepID=UPI003C6E1FBB